MIYSVENAPGYAQNNFSAESFNLEIVFCIQVYRNFIFDGNDKINPITYLQLYLRYVVNGATYMQDHGNLDAYLRRQATSDEPLCIFSTNKDYLLNL